ncbi:PLP-dependent transferase [Trichoderma citrinoviride]|uniref:PLP-dependent transferase n=1 Tax=Trichoderma citrinoviride TaxID=58853 RepID=A0A2T4B702_9HYPO|nr:PLP-dependent transferase [Trichoderma citrinoviride]PTB65116.1 PLP-dependent transferase [Trichoderma citrinoviride]
MDVVSPPKFGRAFGEKHFMFKPGFIHLNQGSYGGYPRPVRDALRSVQDAVQAEPDNFVRYTYPSKLDETRALLADHLHAADRDEIVLVPNATTALNTVLRNLKYQPGDVIAYVQGTYGAIEKTVDYLVETTPVESVRVPFDPITDDDDTLVESFRSVLQEHSGRVRVAIFDTVMSMPGLRMPFERLAQTCREFGVLSAIDGAHGIGLIDLDLEKLGADFLTTNCHKWLFVPHTCAVLYVALKNQHLMRSSIPTSHGFQPLPEILQKKQYISPYEPPDSINPFVFQFSYTGTIDNGPPLCISAAIKFRKEICGGEEAIREYCRSLAREGENLAVEILQTRTLPIPESKRVAFANVQLPLEIASHGSEERGGSVPLADVPRVVDFMLRRLARDYNTFVNIAFISGSLWARFSAQIYLELQDFEYGAKALKELCEKVANKEYVLE